MESCMDWVNNYFANVNNSSYLEIYKLADNSIKEPFKRVFEVRNEE